ncbi:MAG: zinc ABC transporter substrate-binding protein [Acidobacteria bacterium]|nr:zinc ABC transporter substrate-binding protein [Acidobacteriota bacterium]
MKIEQHRLGGFHTTRTLVSIRRNVREWSWRVALSVVIGAGVVTAIVSWSLASTTPAILHVLTTEPSYSDIVRQVGGANVMVRTVDVSGALTGTPVPRATLLSDLAWANVVIRNGLGLDGDLANLEVANPSTQRTEVVVSTLVGPTPPYTPLWYSPEAMISLTSRVGALLESDIPGRASTIQRSTLKVSASLGSINEALVIFRRRYPHAIISSVTPAATTLVSLSDVSNDAPVGIDASPSASAWSAEDAIIASSQPRALIFDPTQPPSINGPLLQRAASAQVPVVAFYPSLPSGYHYQTWIQAELAALVRAITTGLSTPSL